MKRLVAPFVLCLAALGVLAAYDARATPHPMLAQLAPAAVVQLPAMTITVPDPAENVGGFLGMLVDFATKKEWLPALGVLLVGAVALLRLGATKLPGGVGNFFSSKGGGYFLNFVAALATTLGGTLAASVAVTGAVVLQALAAAFVASGVYEAVKDLSSPPKPVDL